MKMRTNIAGAALLAGLFSLFLTGCGNSSATGTTTGTTTAPAAPTAPTGVTATSGINKIVLTWTAVPGATTYHVYWSTDPNVTPATGTKVDVGSWIKYEQVGLYVSQTYYYVVTAVGPGGESAPSQQAATVVATDGQNLYENNCAHCHGPITATTITNGTPDRIQAMIANNTGGMGVLSTLTLDQINTIAAQLPCH
ncbi:c-type cytochrome [Geomesophilobacter sediminis]|uniref:C-type cytochrome n=1 Tax=Geomesophilobacter sediminis TaxID=2798584 RepID=A0A8J7JCU4_9BACT|nr:c-type cytochrome [Geomesophilobacter sediminis]MBJ6725151.1 c-type cytochrome [Geomesophilobacter sediminis]